MFDFSLCEDFFLSIVTREAEALFTEKNLHEETIARSGLANDTKHFVRIEYTREGEYIINEETTPEWYKQIAAKAERNVKETYDKVLPLWAEYQKEDQQEWNRYRKVQQQAWTEQQALDEYQKLNQQALDKYQKAEEQALSKCLKSLAAIPGYIAYPNENEHSRTLY